MLAIDVSNPVVLFEALGLPFFVFFIIGAAVAWYKTESVYLSIAIGIALGVIAFLIFGSTFGIFLTLVSLAEALTGVSYL